MFSLDINLKSCRNKRQLEQQHSSQLMLANIIILLDLVQFSVKIKIKTPHMLMLLSSIHNKYFVWLEFILKVQNCWPTVCNICLSVKSLRPETKKMLNWAEFEVLWRSSSTHTLCLTQILLVLLHFNIWLLKSQSHTLTTYWCFCWTCPYSPGPMGDTAAREYEKEKNKNQRPLLNIFINLSVKSHI